MAAVPTEADADRLRQAQNGVKALIVRDLNAFWETLNLDRPEAARDALLEFLPILVAQYGEVAATVAADWYDEVRAAEGVAGAFRAVAAEVDESAAVAGTVRRAAGQLFTGQPVAALASLTGPIVQYALSGSRETITRSSAADPRAFGWRRVTRSGACPFCRMLAARGAVYREARVPFASHHECNCAAVPAFDPGAPGVDVRVYEASRRTSRMNPAERAEHTARTRAYMQAEGYLD